MLTLLPFVLVSVFLTVLECIIFYKQKTYHTLTYNQKAIFWSVIGVQTVLSIGIIVAMLFE